MNVFSSQPNLVLTYINYGWFRTRPLVESESWQLSALPHLLRHPQLYVFIIEMSEDKVWGRRDFTMYPPIEPYETGMLKVSDLHTL